MLFHATLSASPPPAGIFIVKLPDPSYVPVAAPVNVNLPRPVT